MMRPEGIQNNINQGQPDFVLALVSGGGNLVPNPIFFLLHIFLMKIILLVHLNRNSFPPAFQIRFCFYSMIKNQ